MLLKHLWSHGREIRVDVFQHKVIYDIPLYGDLIFKNFNVELNDDFIKLTTFRCPEHHLVASALAKSLCDNQLIKKELH